MSGASHLPVLPQGFLPQDVLAAYLQAGGAAGLDATRLSELLVQLFAKASLRHSTFVVTPVTFAAALAERTAGEPDPLVTLASLHVEDLYLAQACVLGDAVALRCLNEEFLLPLGQQVRRGPFANHADEAQQMLRVRLLVGHDGEPARLFGYRGTGPLAAWLRLTLTRLVLNLHNAAARETSLDDHLISVSAGQGDPELSYLRDHYRDVVLQAMRESIEVLSSEERAILRMHFIDDLSAADIGSLFQVSGRTIQRRIADTRRQIVERVKEIIGRHVGLNGSQLETIMRLVQSDWNLSLHRLLAAPTEPSGK
ncbi:MAG: sigma factor-like helix-turn-helix DNA-binding protein [Deltaproteobacteria bacterium]|nr:sigma factor-like helix-turn-helix DNA-binding protein [Deltaproteobacteria bacterium]